MDRIKIFHCIKGASNYSNWIPNRELVNTIEEADIVFFEGGTDVFAGRYGEQSHPRSEYPDHKRDDREIDIFKKAVALNKHIIGVCRGSQLCCVMNQGRLVQHQEHQAYTHKVMMYDGSTIETTSSHHQAQYPYTLTEGKDYKLLGWTEGLSSFHYDGEGNEMNPAKEAEIVYYPKTKALSIQGHPEWMISHKDISYYQNLVKLHLEDKL